VRATPVAVGSCCGDNAKEDTGDKCVIVEMRLLGSGEVASSSHTGVEGSLGCTAALAMLSSSLGAT
jgi:hypothetical protein